MKNYFDVLIIGGGASGLVCAIECANGRKVALLEATPKVGKKILVTGNGKCNLTNLDMSADKYNTDWGKDIIGEFSPAYIVDKFAQYGLYCKSDEMRIYPHSESANSVLNVLLAAAKSNGVQIFGDTVATSIERTNDEWKIYTTQGEFWCKKLVLATGSCATFGKASYDLISPFGHTTTKLFPALVPLKSKSIIGANGVRAKVDATLNIDGKKFSESGELLFKDGAISGILAFRMSSHLARASAHGYKSATMAIDFVPEMSERELAQFVEDNYNPRLGMLEGVLHKAIAANIVRNTCMDRSLLMSQEKAEALAHTCKHYVAVIDGLGSLSNAQVVSGGLNLDEWDNHTLRSNKVADLWAMGELLNVDGECGGYNLHWAWASALAVAKDINNAENQ